MLEQAQAGEKTYFIGVFRSRKSKITRVRNFVTRIFLMDIIMSFSTVREIFIEIDRPKFSGIMRSNTYSSLIRKHVNYLLLRDSRPITLLAWLWTMYTSLSMFPTRKTICWVGIMPMRHVLWWASDEGWSCIVLLRVLTNISLHNPSTTTPSKGGSIYPLGRDDLPY